ncbi:MAG: 1,4-alpha-glucan branching protein GlgB [Candidatus Abyssobacteria bacterium SURF_5]|uniref:1,4-alpha-glucan branching enzyme GlgB n=1 Tax=Abyssobacteria bacterium (strain SURF_5) TaxID=2093360 RepID=A0A3A4NIG9_ABYX5|nr:MAG: 1,4-alpha-glucan branching protein GlgB [Candidatus Abyssubacteria bacterium SURF_5]
MNETAAAGAKVRHDVTLLSEDDLYLFNEGSHFRLFDKLGAHLVEREGNAGTCFSVWAPGAERVFVMGDFNEWNKSSHPLYPKGQSGIWEGFIEGVGKGTHYKYHIVSRYHNYRVDKADPLARYYEIPPKTASIVWDVNYSWGDAKWIQNRQSRNSHASPISIYEVHLGSWMRMAQEWQRPLTYREIAPKMAEYVKGAGFTHVQFLPVMEHPFYGSWGYQSLGYFAPTSRYGPPEDFMYLIDLLHQHEIGVILDWVPSHFPSDEHGLGYFDGTHVYEHADPKKGIQPDWNSYIFNYGRNEVRSFLISSALFWMDAYHIDALRVDAVASMLYLDYSRKDGEWVPNEFGGKENLEAIAFLRRFNAEVYKHFPTAQTIAEESTAWPMVSRPTYVGGLGFGMKWDMGWMHDILEYMSKDPVHRKFHHTLLNFRMLYAFHENFVLPLSHDEVVYGKGSLLRKMPGDDWQKFANLRLLLGYMYGQPGKKLLFMGAEFGQWDEWDHEKSLDWHLLDFPFHAGMKRWVEDLNRLYRTEPAMHVFDFDPYGFEWIDCNDSEQSVITFLRKGHSPSHTIVIACNFTPVPRHNYRIGIPHAGFWREILNSDSKDYGGSGQGNLGGIEAAPFPFHGRPNFLMATIPPMGIVFFKCEEKTGEP